MIFTEHKDYQFAKAPLKLVRDCMEGEPRIKAEGGGMTYLKHPSMVDQTSEAALRRYAKYLEGAEFDGYPADMQAQLLGQMLSGNVVADLPSGIDYLEQDSDGDGTSLDGAVEIIYKNVLEAKFHILVAEFDGLGNLDSDSVSVADLKMMNPTAKIKHYTRENLIDWEFKRIGGVMQPTLLMFREFYEERDEKLITTIKRSIIMLKLDPETGDYTQQKYIEAIADSGDYTMDGEPFVPKVGGAPLKWLPVEVVVDEETPSGALPRGMGYLYAVCSATLNRYRMSADYKETIRFNPPTLFTSGWKDGDKEIFKQVNGGRESIEFGVGVSNNMPEGVEVDFKSPGTTLDAYENYFESNGEKISRITGNGAGEKSMQAKTATESASDMAKESAVMRKIVRNTEEALKRMISYCAMFQGLWGADQVESSLDQINLTLPSDFGIKISPEGIMAILSLVQANIWSRAEAIRKLEEGGFNVSNAEQIINEVDSQPPPLV